MEFPAMLRCFTLLSCFLLLAAPGAGARPPKKSDPATEAKGFSEAERTMIALGKRDLVLKLRRSGHLAENFIRAAQNASVGIRLYRAGEYGDALFAFRRSYRFFPSPTLLFWQARTHLLFGNSVMAHSYFSWFLSRAASWDITPVRAAFLAEAKAAVLRLERELGSVQLTVNREGATVLLNGVVLTENGVPLRTPLRNPIWVKPGINILSVTRKGFVNSEITVRALGGKRLALSMNMYTRQELVQQSRLFQQAQLEKRRLARKKRATELRLLREKQARVAGELHRAAQLRWTGLSLLGAGALSLVAGVTLAILAEHSWNTVDKAADGTAWLDLKGDYDASRRYQTAAVYTLSAGSVLVVGGSILWYLATKKDIAARRSTDLQVLPLISGHSAGLHFSLDF